MAVMLPGELAHFLQLLGFEWPEGNEDKAFAYGGAWLGMAGELANSAGSAGQAAGEVATTNHGIGIDAFRRAMDDREGPTRTAGDMALGVSVGGGICYLIAGAIIALKIAVIIQLVQFAITVAQAIAAAVPTAGASMSIIPIAKIIAQKAIEFAINLAIEKLLG